VSRRRRGGGWMARLGPPVGGWPLLEIRLATSLRPRPSLPSSFLDPPICNPPRSVARSPNTLLIKNLPFSSDEGELMELFGKAGTVRGRRKNDAMKGGLVPVVGAVTVSAKQQD
jgi:hypothetical protein